MCDLYGEKFKTVFEKTFSKSKTFSLLLDGEMANFIIILKIHLNHKLTLSDPKVHIRSYPSGLLLDICTC